MVQVLNPKLPLICLHLFLYPQPNDVYRLCLGMEPKYLVVSGTFVNSVCFFFIYDFHVVSDMLYSVHVYSQ